MSLGCGNADDAGTPEGRYANYFEIGHNAFEFLFDFGQFYTEQNRAHLLTRIIMGPAYASAFLDILQKAIHQYIESYGPIPERDSQGHGNAQ